jgi:hypothetical protein
MRVQVSNFWIVCGRCQVLAPAERLCSLEIEDEIELGRLLEEEITAALGHRGNPAAHAMVAICWGRQMTNFRDRNQYQHSKRRHRE